MYAHSLNYCHVDVWTQPLCGGSLAKLVPVMQASSEIAITQKLTAQLELPPEFSNETTLSPTVKFLGLKVFLG
jgi:hypothetical protein